MTSTLALEALQSVFGRAFLRLSVTEVEALVNDVVDLQTHEQLPTLMVAAKTLRGRISPATLESYVRTLLAGKGVM
jgi:hypothetical protein